MRGLGIVITRRLRAAENSADLKRGLDEQGRARSGERYQDAANGRGRKASYAEGHGVERERVYQTLSWHDVGNERHTRRIGDDPGQSHEEYEREDVPRLEIACQDDRREDERDSRLVAVNEGHELSAVEIVNQQSADRANEQDGQRVESESDACPEGGVGDLVGQPADDYLLKPEPAGGEHSGEPDEDVVAVAERIECVEATAHLRGADMGPVHSWEDAAPGRTAGQDRVGFQLNGLPSVRPRETRPK